MKNAYLLLGSNLGDRMSSIESALSYLENEYCVIQKCSSFYESEAWGGNAQNYFVNIAIHLKTGFTPKELLLHCKQIEMLAGRKSYKKWGDREIDIDILFYENETFTDEQLLIPHPYLQERKFVLLPLAEIALQYMHPVEKKTIRQLLHDCKDPLNVKKINEHKR
ncbi:MAG TPA: 2-amino-4-hydroxy-6-hydroxymethyldihydropteridine diphosphokinase [Bacteroidia bacterium]|nr:2-amino-4-hydroxy-6-hydroxymethyldihydropteridine diphosphokinase [Bacteroidia bacterium]HNT79924.1 2-amino-4-hydroxy-6-hydroxymethyldihydropteridine diphosphokinase [Bacteroidia bacterium]